MKITDKKVFCANCQKFVKGREQKADATLRIICPRCDKPIWIWENLAWRYVGEPAQ